jgi:plastocyanin domain-containing protein
MNKTVSIIITLGLVIGIGIIFVGQSQNNTDTTSVQAEQNVEIRDGIQYVTINAKGGYSPKVSTAKVGIPTKLVIKTNGTYDCSSSLVIRSIGYQKVLAQTGEEIIDIGTPEAGTPLQGTCSMGMYSFSINFS